VVGNEGVGRNADNFLEQIKGEQIVGKGTSNRTKQSQGKTGIESCLRVLLQSAHVSHRIEDGDYPEKGGNQGKDHGKIIGPE
jgi:hypothetical protein